MDPLTCGKKRVCVTIFVPGSCLCTFMRHWQTGSTEQDMPLPEHEAGLQGSFQGREPWLSTPENSSPLSCVPVLTVPPALLHISTHAQHRPRPWSRSVMLTCAMWFLGLIRSCQESWVSLHLLLTVLSSPSLKRFDMSSSNLKVRRLRPDCSLL